MPCGKDLRIVTTAPTRLHWSFDNWTTAQDSVSRDTGVGIQVVDLPTEMLAVGRQITFTFYWPEAQKWEGRDFTVEVA